MNIGDKIKVVEDGANVIMSPFSIKEISNVVPVQYKNDDEENEWYEVCDASKTDTTAIICKDIDGEDVILIIDKKTCNIDLLLDLF